MNKNKWRPYIRIRKVREYVAEKFTLFRISFSYTGHVYLLTITLFGYNFVHIAINKWKM